MILKRVAGTWFFVAAVSTSPAVYAESNRVAGFAALENSLNGVHTNLLNPSNILGIPTAENGTVLLIEGVQHDISFRVRAQAAKTNVPETPVSALLVVQELNRVAQLSEKFSLSIGKRIFSLDQSFIGQPLGFFQKQTSLSDPTDQFSQAEGLPMVVANWISEKASLAAIYSKDFGSYYDGTSNRGLTQWLLKAGYEFNDVSTAVIVRRATGESIGIGGTFSATSSTSTAWYGSFYSAKGTLRPIPGFLVDSSAGGNLRAKSSLGFYRKDNGVPYPRLAIGGILTFKGLPRAQVEVTYDRRGLSDGQYDALLKSIRSMPDRRPVDFRAPTFDPDKASYLALFQSIGIRRKYFALTLDDTVGDVAVAGGAYVGLADFSAVYFCSANYKLTNRLQIFIAGTLYRGSSDSERQIGAISRTLSTRLKWTF